MVLKTSDNGLFYFESLPEDYKLATWDDFLKAEERTPFLVLGNIWQVYQCYRASSETNMDYLKEFINENRVFVK